MTSMRGKILLLVGAAWLACAAASAYVVKLKDGSLIFARTKYSIRGAKAIITLENGTVTQIDLAKVDVPGTDKYNAENFGNVIAIDAPQRRPEAAVPTPPSPARLRELVREKRTGGQLAPPSASTSSDPGGATGQSWQPVDADLQSAFERVFEGAGISQFRLAHYRGTTRLLVTANTEEAVFNALSASARALSDLAARGKGSSIEIVLTTSSGETAGTFDMTTEQARLLVNGATAVSDYFVKNVVF
jgi:hypothetical protein